MQIMYTQATESGGINIKVYHPEKRTTHPDVNLLVQSHSSLDIKQFWGAIRHRAMFGRNVLE